MAGYGTDLGHLLLDALPGLVWTALPDGQAEYIGKQWLDYTGLTFEQAIGAGWIGAVHPDDLSRLLST
jgi:PAS domain-containing protein